MEIVHIYDIVKGGKRYCPPRAPAYQLYFTVFGILCEKEREK